MKKKILIAICLVILSAVNVWATDVALFMNEIGASPAALGGAYTAMAGKVYSHYYNPAGAARADVPQVQSTFFSIYDTDLKDFSLLLPSKYGNIAISYLSADMDPLKYTETDPGGRPEPVDGSGTFSAGASKILITWADSISNIKKTNTPWDDLSLGVQFEMLSETIENSKGTAGLINLGVHYDYQDIIHIGLKLRNLLGTQQAWSGNSTIKEDVDRYIRLGLKYNMLPEVLEIMVDYSIGNEFTEPLMLGAKYYFSKEVALLVGSGRSSYSLGLDLELSGISFSYSYISPTHELLSSSSRVTIGFDI